MAKFDETYKMIMEGKYSDYREDAGNYFGKSRYTTDSVGSGNVQLVGLRNGQPVVNPATGEQVYWTVTATHYNCFDAVSGEKLVAPRIVFELRWGNSKNNALYVARETYENAYASEDPVAIAKLKAIGLEPGYIFN